MASGNRSNLLFLIGLVIEGRNSGTVSNIVLPLNFFGGDRVEE
jgi:hypothetical protein